MNLIKSFLLILIFIFLYCFPAKNLTDKNIPITIVGDELSQKVYGKGPEDKPEACRCPPFPGRLTTNDFLIEPHSCFLIYSLRHQL